MLSGGSRDDGFVDGLSLQGASFCHTSLFSSSYQEKLKAIVKLNQYAIISIKLLVAISRDNLPCRMELAKK